MSAPTLPTLACENSLGPKVWRVENRTFSSNTYICATEMPGECIVIDPGLNPELIDERLIELGLRLVGVFCTHGHFDHVGSADYFKKKYDVPLYLHRDDLRLMKSANFLLMACKIDARIAIPTADFQMSGGDEVQISGATLRYVHVPGHTPGSCFVEYRGAVFTGDSLYLKAVGLVDFPGENSEQLRESLLRIWDQIPDTHIVYPGHGGSGSFGTIKTNNVRLRRFLGLEAEEDGVQFSKRMRAGSEVRRAFQEELE